jgi:hypothetical protein
MVLAIEPMPRRLCGCRPIVMSQAHPFKRRAPVHKHRGALLSSSRRRKLIHEPDFSFLALRRMCLDFSSSVSRPTRVWPSHVWISTRFRIVGGTNQRVAWQNDRPETHTVILRLARSFILPRWRHSISLKTSGPGGHHVRPSASPP